MLLPGLCMHFDNSHPSWHNRHNRVSGGWREGKEGGGGKGSVSCLCSVTAVMIELSSACLQEVRSLHKLASAVLAAVGGTMEAAPLQPVPPRQRPEAPSLGDQVQATASGGRHQDE